MNRIAHANVMACENAEIAMVHGTECLDKNELGDLNTMNFAFLSLNKSPARFSPMNFEFLSLNKSRAEIHGGGFKVWVEFMKRFQIAGGGGHCSELRDQRG